MNRDFSKIWIVVIVLTLLIIFLGGVLIYYWLTKTTELGASCSPPYFTGCKTRIDCILQTKCQAGRGIKCLPQCKMEGISWSCVHRKCVWSKRERGSLEKDLIPL